MNSTAKQAAFLPSPYSCPIRQFSGRRRRLGAMLVRASWGQDVQFTQAKIIETGKLADNLHRLYVDITTTTSSGYTTAGQFIQAKVGDSKPGFFAIASPPNPSSGIVELLIKSQGGTAELLCQLKEGSDLQVSAVMGKGFDISNVPSTQYKKMYCFATGSGISPIKALIESNTLKTDERDITKLYFGVRNPSSMAYGDKLKAWEKDHGVVVVPVFSEDGKGYVQDRFVQEGGVASSGAETAAVLCGQKDMAQAVTEVLVAGGVDKSAILLNF